MMDLGLYGELDGEETAAEPDTPKIEESESDKLEIPQDIIDQISDDTTDNSDIIEETPDEIADVEESEEETLEADDGMDESS